MPRSGRYGRRPRQIGPIGTASRAVGGLIAIALPIALSGLIWWDVLAALVVLPLVTLAASVLVTASYERFAPKSLARRHAICSGPGCVLVATVLAVAVALAAVTPVSGVAIWGFFGVSMLVAAERGYAGCEVLAIPNAITGRSDRIGCVLYTPIDRAEARHREPRSVGAITRGDPRHRASAEP
jgi:hypothetical protein